MRKTTIIMIILIGCSNKTSGGDADFFDDFDSRICCAFPEPDIEREDFIDILYEFDFSHSHDYNEIDDNTLIENPIKCNDTFETIHVELNPLHPLRPPMPCGPNCRQVSFAESNVIDWHIDINDNGLVFSSGGTGIASYTGRVWLVDLTTLDHYVLHETNSKEALKPGVGYPTIDDKKINYLFVSNEIEGINNRVIYRVISYDISKNNRSQIWCGIYETKYPCQTPAGLMQIEFYGHYLAYWDGRICASWGGQVFLYDIETGEERLLSPNGWGASNISMDGNWVVWEQGAPGYGKQIWVHDIARNESRPITGGRLDKWSPYVHGNRIVWAECFADGCTKYDGLSADIMMMDIDTEMVTHITNDIHLQSHPVIGDNIIAWTDCRNDPENTAECWNSEFDIYIKDLNTGEERQLTNLPGGNEVPVAIWGNKVYFIKPDLERILSVFEITI